MADILLSIHPVDRIFAGDKRYEYRKRLPAQKVERVVVYSSSPVCRIVGEFSVSEVLTMGPSLLWTKTHDGAGISFAKFNAYFFGRTEAHALAVGSATKYPKPIDPRAVDPKFSGPQSFAYIASLSHELKRALAEASG